MSTKLCAWLVLAKANDTSTANGKRWNKAEVERLCCMGGFLEIR
jgi:hypothetical protein